MTSADLARHEAIIEQNPDAYLLLGTAFATIRERKLYPQKSFSAYCVQRWHIRGGRGSQLIISARVAIELQAAGHRVPEREWHARILAEVPAEIRPQVWARALETTQGQPNASAIQAAQRQIEAPDTGPLLNKAGRRYPKRSQQRAITAGVNALQGLCAGLAQIDAIDPAINEEEAAQWVRDLSESLRVLRSLTTKLKEHSHGNHR